MLGDDDLGTAGVQVGDEGVAVEGFVSDQRAKIYAVEEWQRADRIVTVAGQQVEAHEIAERIGQRQDLGGQLLKKAGRSRHGLPVRTTHSTALTNNRLSFATSARVRRLAQSMRLHLRPLGVRQNESFHPKLESQTSFA